MSLYTSTFSQQDLLPSLPVPPLTDTLSAYLKSVQPHVTAETFAQTKALVENFEHGLGEKLQLWLMQYAKHKRNWLETWWLELAYLKTRVSLVPFFNIGGPPAYTEFCYWKPWPNSQWERSAVLLRLVGEYWLKLRQEAIAPHENSSGDYICMNQYHNLFNFCRIPGEKCDSIKFYFKTEREGPAPDHIIIFIKGYIFSFSLIYEDCLLSSHEIYAQILKIREDVERLKYEEKFPIAALTALPRSDWAKLRSHLISLSKRNETNLEIIQSSIAYRAFDDSVVKNIDDHTRSCLVGEIGNRWFDKYGHPIDANGVASSNSDHTPFEGIPQVLLTQYSYSRIKNTGGRLGFENITGSVDVSKLGQWTPIPTPQPLHSSIPKPQLLTFDTDDIIKDGIAEAKKSWKLNTDNLVVISPTFSHYGKTWMKKVRCHPDTHVQLSLQLAYYRVHNKPAPTYETASTRKFFHGRTETVRSCTPESFAWAKSMTSFNSISQEKENSIDDNGNIIDQSHSLPIKSTFENQYNLLMKAFNAHLQLMSKASNGKGCDRHILGLRAIAEAHNIPDPDIFSKDPAWRASGGDGNFILSTSFLGFTGTHGAAAPMRHDGYGVFYRINEEKIVFSISCWKDCAETNVHDLFQSICTALIDMRTLVIEGKKLSDSDKTLKTPTSHL